MNPYPKFTELPVEVQVAIINAASKIATIKIKAVQVAYSKQISYYEREYDLFDREYKRICDTLNKGR